MKLFSFTADAEKYWSMLFTISRQSDEDKWVSLAVAEMEALEKSMRYEGAYEAFNYEEFEKEFIKLNNT